MMEKKVLILVLLASIANLAICFDRQADCKCRINPRARIVGGALAGDDTYPWMASVTDYEDADQKTPYHHGKDKINQDSVDTHSCAGVLLNERWVLTTTTCVAGHTKPKKSARDYSVGFGHQNDLEKIYHYRVRAKSIVMHPEFGVVDGLIVNDVALLELDTAVTFNYTKESSIGPACLATTNYNRFVETKNLNVIENLVVAGYGYTKTVRTYKGGAVLDEFRGERIENNRWLVDVTMKDISAEDEDCQEDSKKLCLFGKNTFYESMCFGDLGSPAHYTFNGRSYVLGLVQYAYGRNRTEDNVYRYECADVNIATRVPSYIDWIESHIGQDYCKDSSPDELRLA